MTINFDLTSILLATVGGNLMSVATSFNLYLTGRITGWSGILYGLSSHDQPSLRWKLTAISGAVTAGCIGFLLNEYFLEDKYTLIDTPLVYLQNLDVFGWILSGFLVGLGTKLGNGCTSGHGVCGLPRLSIRSYVAVGMFMLFAILTSTLRYYEPFLNNGPNLNAVYDQWVVCGITLSLAVLLCAWNFVAGSIDDHGRIDTVISYLTGLIFGIGLIISGMTRREKVIGFLTISDGWDPTLAFVLIGAVIPNFFTFNRILKMPKPIYADHFDIPNNNRIDLSLLLGASIFGIGWGICGICPGPTIVMTSIYAPDLIMTFIPFMIIGQKLGNYIQTRSVGLKKRMINDNYKEFD